ncbi:hypothetical protein OHJ16_05640 [Actinomyces israelii]|uniref:Uncharacterized protein n=1 Tax=Actinomyces israelii TaxID=1659 RepID=A0ABT4I861_9ACTO|nr:hypothetical protein [Actinomyces israelii]MCZ0857524.1 hypothetical protein [Actinomyces israelii]
MTRSGPGERPGRPGADRPRPAPRQWVCVIGGPLAVLAILVTAVVAPVNGGWWWVQRAAFVLVCVFWCALFSGALRLRRRRRAANPALCRRGVRAATAVVAVIAVVFGAGAVMILGLTVRSLVAGPQEVDVAQCLGLSSRGPRSGQKAQLVTGAGERLDGDVSGSIGSDVDDRLRRLCAARGPFTMRWHPPKGPVLEIREG